MKTAASVILGLEKPRTRYIAVARKWNASYTVFRIGLCPPDG